MKPNWYWPQSSEFMSFLINTTAYLIGFKKANADKHDIAYEIGGIERDRIRADTGFLRYLLIDSEGNFLKALVAYIFYFSVRLFGRKHFNYSS